MDPESLSNIIGVDDYHYSVKNQYIATTYINGNGHSIDWNRNAENYELEFTDKETHEVVGKLEIKNGKLVFNGDIEESAKLFIEYINLMNT